MEKIELSKRLQKVAEFVKPDKKMLDIGSDHAQLPIYLISKKIIPIAIAGEVAKLPYENAKKQVAVHRLTDKISVRLGSGFEVLKGTENIGTAVISGMGGVLIADIIKKGLYNRQIDQETRLVLQPNNNQPALRKFLMDYQFKIENEVMIKENNKYNEIIVAHQNNQNIDYNEEDLIFGPVFLKKQSNAFQEKWQKKYAHHQMILEKLDQEKHKSKFRKLTKSMKQIERVLE